jgi:hypothetical protein
VGWEVGREGEEKRTRSARVFGYEDDLSSGKRGIVQAIQRICLCAPRRGRLLMYA